MTPVFIGGSRKLSRLDDAVRTRLDNIIRQGLPVLIGDAIGADKAVQEYLSSKNYPHVIVYCMNNRYRNNLGNWPTKNVASKNTRRDFVYYAIKDHEMAVAAFYGLMIWDGRSRGTLRNIIDLLQQGKKVLVYFSKLHSFRTLRSISEFEKLSIEFPPYGSWTQSNLANYLSEFMSSIKEIKVIPASSSGTAQHRDDAVRASGQIASRETNE